MRVSDLQREAQLESERLRDVESRLAQANKEISTKEQSLMRTQDQLTRAQTRITQETDRVIYFIFFNFSFSVKKKK